MQAAIQRPHEKNTGDTTPTKQLSGRRVFLWFLAFFGFIVVINTVFITFALNTHPGVIVEKSYEQGLNFNNRLEQAESQPALQQTISYEAGTLRWRLADAQGRPLKNAIILAKIVRPVQDGHDFETSLNYAGAGLYEAPLDLPFKGHWKAHLKATWDNQLYQTTHSFNAQ